MFFKKKKKTEKLRIKKSKIEIRFYKELKSLEVTFDEGDVKYKLSSLMITPKFANADFKEVNGSKELAFSVLGNSRTETAILLYVRLLSRLSKSTKDRLIETLVK